MENLTQLKETFEGIFGEVSRDDITARMLDVVLSDDAAAVYTQWIEAFPDLTHDTLQQIFQYYFVDRKEKMQDYTPPSLGRLTACLTAVEGEKEVFDMCAGSGALSIQKWNLNKDLFFYCMEFDERVIPFLIFNLAIRNISAFVIHGDVLSGEQFAVYELKRDERFSSVGVYPHKVVIRADSCISNPPYNMRWDAKSCKRFDVVPPAGNANYAFILTALECADWSEHECSDGNSKTRSARPKRSALILPMGVLSPETKEEKAIFNSLIAENRVDTVIANPDKMFEATTIGTCILVLDKRKTRREVAFVDMQQTYTEIEREQNWSERSSDVNSMTRFARPNGQFGCASHTNRTYKKTVKTYSDDDIGKIFGALLFRVSIKEFCSFVKLENITERDGLVPSRYIEFDYTKEGQARRRYFEIVDSINAIRRERNACKLVINQTIATRDFGLDLRLGKSDDAAMNEMLKKVGAGEIIKDDYVSFTKKAGEVTLINGERDRISSILVLAVNQWKQHIYFLNEAENKYLAELRDTLLPDLMSGKIEV